MHTFELQVGRLCELRMFEDFNANDMPLFRSRMASTFSATTGKLHFCNDLRRPRRFGPEEERQLTEIMRADSPRLGRSAFLVTLGTPMALQVRRLTGETEHRGRRVFHERADLELWLGEVLTDEEKARLHLFLDG